MENKMARYQFKHGRYNSKEYHVWEAMIQRCQNPNNPRYSDYGGRGITFCESWRDFTNFISEMGDAPHKHSLDRIDNNKGYCKENCRWVDSKTQQRNMRRNVLFEINGVKKCRKDWCDHFGVNYSTARYRQRSGWNTMQIFGLEPPPIDLYHQKKS